MKKIKINLNKQKAFKNKSGITLIALVITIIVLLILAGFTISTLTGENGILKQAENAKDKTEIATEREAIQLTITNYNSSNEEKYNIGEKLYDKSLANGDKWSIVMENDSKTTYGTDWHYVGKGIELEGYGKTNNEWVINYTTGEVIELEKEKFTKLKYGENLAVKEGLILNADPVNMSNGESWGEGVTLHGVQEGDGYGWNGAEFKLDGVDDYIQVYPSNEINIEKGLTFEFYATAQVKRIRMLGKTDMESSNYTANRFRIRVYDNRFLCCMSERNAKSDWLSPDGAVHWISKDLGSFASEEGGYVTMTANLETNTVELYWNGEFLGSTVCDHEWMVSGGLTDETIPFTVGMLVADDGNGLEPLYTKMDLYACRLYNKVLTSEEIKQNHDLTVAYHNLLVQENE